MHNFSSEIGKEFKTTESKTSPILVHVYHHVFSSRIAKKFSNPPSVSPPPRGIAETSKLLNAKPKYYAPDYVKITRAALEFKILTLQAELKLLLDLAAFSDEEKLGTIFFLLYKDRDGGSISAVELTDGLRKVCGDVDFKERPPLAIARVASFDTDGDAKLSFEENLILYGDTLLGAMGYTFHGKLDLKEFALFITEF